MSKEITHNSSLGMSFIIPCYNEASNISRTLASGIPHVPPQNTWEILVVDNGSTDGTRALATAAGAKVLDGSGLSLGALRNVGAANAQYDVLVFLDADISLTEDWSRAAANDVATWVRDDSVITGSWPDVPPSASWIAKSWHPTRQKVGDVSHLGTGHLITSRKVFGLLSGFNEELSTGEDFDLCTRARRLGVRVVARPALRVIHRGEPNSLKEFFLREMWHGIGDRENTRLSPIVAASVAHAGLHFALLASIIILPQTGISSVILLLSTIFFLLLVGARRKHKWRGIFSFPGCVFLTWVYLWARFLSWVGLRGRRSRV